jgi:thiamine pyrophosphate-dependent acetolactate synthase large subunit-like protein
VTRTGGAWVVEALRAEGVRHVFGIPGVHNLAVYDALFAQSDRREDAPAIAHVLARHEQGAAFMADGYARASGTPGVVLVTTGPGATNVLTPLAESYASSIPIVVVMSDVARDLLGRELGALHEVPNQIDCFKPLTRWAETVTEGAAITTAIAGAFDLLRTGRPGPVALSIPNDVLGESSESVVRTGRAGRRPPCHPNEIADAARMLARAERPLVVAGGGVVSAGAEGEMVAVARRLGAPIITTVMGRGTIPETDPLWLGVMPNKRATEDAFREADVVLAVGCRFAARSTKGLLLNLEFAPHQALIHLDLDPTVIGKMFKPALGIVGDAKDGLTRLAAALGSGAAATRWDATKLDERRRAASARYTPALREFMAALRAGVPGDGIVAHDQTGVSYWAEWFQPVLAPRTFLYPNGSATLGYAVPAAIGAQIACPGRAVVAVVGDGGFMFSVNELATAVKYRLPIAFLIVNDDRYGAIKWLQEAMFGRSGEADLANPDFVALARAFGARAERLSSTAALPAALAAAFRAEGPTVLELRLTVEPPWEM